MDKRDKKQQQASDVSEGNNEDELTRLAMEELSKGAKRAKERTQTMGALGWKYTPVPSANKIYLKNTIIGALQSNVRIDNRATSSSKKPTQADRKSNVPSDNERRKQNDGEKRKPTDAEKRRYKHEEEEERSSRKRYLSTSSSNYHSKSRKYKK